MERVRSISVVDDDESCRASVVGYLRSFGHAAHGFASAEAFLDSEQLGATECLVLDVRMPGMSGLELQCELRTRRPRLPIIFVTAHGDEQTHAQAVRGGAVDCLPKPFVGEALLAAIHRALGEADGATPREAHMERIEVGFQTFTADGNEEFGAVRNVSADGILVYVENAGEFRIPLAAVRAVHSQKVIVDCRKLEQRLRDAIGHAHDAEDPSL